MTEHPPLQALIERSEDPEVADHLSSCPPCRAQARLLAGLEAVDASELPDIESARAAMRLARLQASRSFSLSLIDDGEDTDDRLVEGQSIDRYVVERRLGSGGMGTVYRVRHSQLGSHHALKLLHRTSRSVRARLVREGQAQSRLRHPNVVPVTDIVDIDGAPGLIMEFVEGPTLAEYLRDTDKLPLAEIDRLAEQIIRGVGAAHSAGVVHRDLKPANVLLVPTDEGFVAKVCDFGLARLLDSSSSETELTRPATPLGTPAYMAPEQIRDATRADARSDIFSLGAVLYELATGQRAFQGAQVMEIYDRVRAGDYTPAHQVAPELPSRIARTISRALQLDPTQRFGDCHALLAAWRGEVELAPLTSSGSSRRLAAVLSAAAVVVVAGAAAVGVAQCQPDPGTASLVAAAAPAPTERRLTALPDDLQVYALALSPDGSLLAFAEGRGLWVQQVDEGTERLLMPGGPYHSVDFFPDGERLLVAGWQHGVEGTWEVPVDGGEASLLLEQSGSWVRLSPDASQVAIADERGLWLQPLGGGTPTRLRPLIGGYSTIGLTWSPSGRYLAATHHSSTGEGAWVEITAADGSTTRRVVEDPRLDALGVAALAWVAPDTLLYGLAPRGETKDFQIWAIEGASEATDHTPARLVHSWERLTVIRLRPSADASRIAYSRVSTSREAYVIDLEDAGPPRELGSGDWSYSPLQWTDDQTVLSHSDRGGGGLYALPLDGTEAERVLEFGYARWADRVDDALIVSTFDKGDKHEVSAFNAVRISDTDGTRSPFLELETDPHDVMGRLDLYQLRCRSQRCLFSEPVGDTLHFAWVDSLSGERSPTLIEHALTSRSVAWDLSPDELQLVILDDEPAREIRYDLDTMQRTERPLDLELPQAVSWAPDGETLYATGLVQDSEDPYRVVSIAPDGQVTILWTSMSWFFHSVIPSPNGRYLAVGVYAFDDDTWLLEGLLP